MIHGNEMVMGAELAPCEALIDKVMLERGGIPGEIAFTTSTFHDALSPALCALGVRSTIGEAPEFVERLLVSLRKHLGGSRAWQALPETIVEWKRVDQEVSSRLHDAAIQEHLLTPVAMRRYFGSVELGKRALAELSSLSPLPAFIEWAVSDYCPPTQSKPLVERLLKDADLDRAERVLLEARRSAQLSIYRVDACQPGATLDVEDILSGERLVVNDSALSGCGLEGFFLPLRLLRVGGWIFPCLGGPPLSGLLVERFLERLEDARVRLGKAGLRRHSDQVGDLWGWVLEAHAAEPRLTNTDGEALELHTAVFLVEDRAALVSALAARQDIAADTDGTWSWLRPGGPAPGFGERTVLAHLELHDDRLVVEVNSAERLQRAREWLEEIPGVRFEQARRADLEQMPVDDLLPSKPPPPLSPAMRAEATRHFHRTCRAWIDERVPALGNKTPRAACKTAAGRRRVARLIRSMPSMHAPGGSIAPPREEMLRELGIEQ